MTQAEMRRAVGVGSEWQIIWCVLPFPAAPK